MTDLERRGLVFARLVEAVREIGILLIALSPLDWVLAEGTRRAWLLIFLLLGILFFAGSIIAERRAARGH